MTSTRNRFSAMAVAAVILAVALGLAGGLAAAGAITQDDPVPTPGEGSVDVGFARDMQVHHAQAVRMSTLVRERTEDPDIDTLALDILLTQQHQIGQMHAWLTMWGLPQTGAAAPMTWMDHTTTDSASPNAEQDHHAPASSGSGAMAGMASMPGMATPEQLDRLAAAQGEEAERLFLQLMIPHHRGALAMAEAAAENASQPQVRNLAQAILDSQAAEIAVLETMLAERGGPLPGTS